MDLRYTEAEEKFRADLRSWLESEVPAHGSPPPSHDWEARRAYDTGWQRKLYDAGYAGINWPKEYGGRDATLVEQLIYYEEIARADAPYVGVNVVGLLHDRPTLMAEGTDAQKAKWLQPIIAGELQATVAYTEPQSRYDLANIQTRATRDGDEWLISGAKG